MLAIKNSFASIGKKFNFIGWSNSFFTDFGYLIHFKKYKINITADNAIVVYNSIELIWNGNPSTCSAFRYASENPIIPRSIARNDIVNSSNLFTLMFDVFILFL